MKRDDFELIDSIIIPDRSDLKGHEICFLMDKLSKAKSRSDFYNILFDVIMISFRLGYVRGVKREKIEARKRSTAYAKAKHKGCWRVTQ